MTLEQLLSQPLQNRETRRCDCPFCDGKKTFSITRMEGTILYRCFRASCDQSGARKLSMSKGDILDFFRDAKKEIPVKEIPDRFVSIKDNNRVLDYLRDYNCISAYNHKKVSIQYDVAQERIVFTSWYNGNPNGAVGRAINNSRIPKWVVYLKAQEPFVIPMNGTYFNPDYSRKAIICEDVCSACAVSSFCDGVALLGTHFQKSYLDHLTKYYDCAIIALDKDASKKALDIHKEISPYVQCKIKLLQQDLKYFNEKQIKDIFLGL